MGQNNGWEPVEEPKGWTAVEETPASSSVSPIAPPPLTTAGKPNVQMHKSFLVGNPNSSADNTSQSLQNKIGDEVMGQLKGAANVTAPMIAYKLYKATHGDEQAKADVKELPANMALFLAMQMAGQGGQPGKGFAPKGPKVGPETPTTLVNPDGTPYTGATSAQLVRRALTGRFPGSSLFEHTKSPTIAEVWRRARARAVPVEAEPAPSVPTGPPELWGKVVKGVGPNEPNAPALNRLWWQQRGGVTTDMRPGFHHRVSQPMDVPGATIKGPGPQPGVVAQPGPVGETVHYTPDPVPPPRPAPAWQRAPVEPTEVPSLLEREGGIPEPSQRVKPAPKVRPEPAWKTNPQPTTEVPSLLEREGGIPEPKIRVKPVGPPKALRELAEKYGYEDLSDKSVVESMRNDLERHGRILDHQRAAEADAAIRPTKADLVAKAKKAKMPTAEGKPAAGPAPDPKTSLLELMQKSVEAAHANKGGPLDHATFFKLLRQALQAKGEL